MKKEVIIISLLGALAFTGCKPTEKNYRAAYEAAIGKREAEKDAIKSEGLISEDGPRAVYMDGDTLWFATETLRHDTRLKPINVAVSRFKMSTNAESGAKALQQQGFDSYAVKAYGDKWFIIGGSFDSLDSAREFMTTFKKKNPTYPYIGLDGHPVIIRM